MKFIWKKYQKMGFWYSGTKVHEISFQNEKKSKKAKNSPLITIKNPWCISLIFMNFVYIFDFFFYEHTYKPIFIKIVPKHSDFFIVLGDITQKYSGGGGDGKKIVENCFFCDFSIIFRKKNILLQFFH